MQVTFITTRDQADAQFNQAVPLLQPVVDEAGRGEFLVADLRRLTAEGNAITGLGFDDSGAAVLAMVFEFVHYPQQTAVNIIALGGAGLVDAAPYWQAFRDWCKSAGATVIEASCSPAMARMLRKYGFDVAYQVVRSAI